MLNIFVASLLFFLFVFLFVFVVCCACEFTIRLFDKY